MLQGAAVSVVENKKIFCDLICDAVAKAGHVAYARKQENLLDIDLSHGEALIAHITSIDALFPATIISLRQKSPGSPIIMICPKSMLTHARATLGTTVNAIIPDDMPLNVLIGALNISLCGLTVVHPSQLGSHTTRSDTQLSPQSEDVQCIVASLSERERAILTKVREGYSNKEVARALEISDSTVKVHLRSVFLKIGAKNRTHAATWANTVQL